MPSSTRLATAVFTVLTTSALLLGPALADPSRSSKDDKSSQHRSTGLDSQQKIQQPPDCEDIKAGTTGGREEAAAQKECVRSQHLGGGTGTSSGTGSGKMGPGGGPR